VNILDFRSRIGNGTDEEVLEAVNSFYPDVRDYESARAKIWAILCNLLDRERYIAAATLLWGRELFDGRPESVSRIFHALNAHAKTFLVGATSMGKSYSVIAWLLLDWLRDPLNTGTRIVSVTARHAESNTFSTLQRFYQEAVIKLPGIDQHNFIGMGTKDRHSSMSLVAIRKGESGYATLKGYHPVRRRHPHPVFGWLTRVRVFLDEAEDIPAGVWKALANLLGNMEGRHTVKAIGAWNPANNASISFMMSEPKKGWGRIDLDTDKEWVSKRGYHVLRLDAADCENVKQRRKVYEGLQTWEGYNDLRSVANGADAPFLCFGRAMYYMLGGENCYIPGALLDDVMGEYVFSAGTEVRGAGIDLAWEGDDKVIVAGGRYGEAVGFRPVGQPMIPFDVPRWTAQLDNFYEMPKARTLAQAAQLIDLLEQLGCDHNFVTLDRTGDGRGVGDAFIEEHGWNEVRGMVWGESASHTKILEDDKDYCDEVYFDNTIEMWGCLKRWLEFGYVKIAAHVQTERCFQEIKGRRFRMVGKGPTGKPLMALEKKKDFRARYDFSPDYTDALVQFLHGCRMAGKEKAQMARKARMRRLAGQKLPDVDNVKFVDFSRDQD